MTMLRNGRIGRKEFLKRSMALGLTLPAAGALLAACGGDEGGEAEPAPAEPAEPAPAEPAETGGAEPAAPSGVDLEGITIKFAKAPHGETELDLYEEWLQPFKDATGAEIEHTIIPWDQLEALYTANFAGDDPYDVMYQVSTHLTLFGEQGNFEDMTSWMAGDDWASERPHFSDAIIAPSIYKGVLYGVPHIIGAIVNYVNLDLIEGAGLAVPTTTDELVEVGTAVTKDDTWGFHVTQTTKDFNWYFNLQNVHNLGGDIIAEDYSGVTINSDPVIQATQVAADLILTQKIQPPVGAYDREGGISLFKQGKLAVILDEPLRITPFEEEGLPFNWDIDLPVGAPGGGRTVFSTTGHWVMHARSQIKDAAWELIKFLSAADFTLKSSSHYGFVPVRDDVDVSGGNPKIAKSIEFAHCCWDGLVTHPKISQILDEYSKGLEAACVGSSSVEDALNTAQTNAEAILAG
jgi:ABC-type glycerol-3-phosphate transport system substrate-binding protein